MKCKLCGHNLTNEADEYDDEDLDYGVLEAKKWPMQELFVAISDEL